MELGFSVIGLGMLVMLLVPNILWARKAPRGYVVAARGERRSLKVLERTGQVAVSASAVMFTCPQGFSLPWLLWLVPALASMVAYEAAWVRHLGGTPTIRTMYQPLGPIPMPLATLPVAAFALYGIWQQSPVTLIATGLLGLGHIGIHLDHLRELGGRH